MLKAGQVLQNRYRIVSLLGQGGMGAVYRAWDTRLGVPVALKEMTPQPGVDPRLLAQLRQQFEQEAQVLARLTHPHLVRVTDFFEEGGSAYLVMNFVEGENLAERVEREGALAEALVVGWGEQLLDALGYCHEQGVIHRDVKPQNVIIRPDGQVVLVDFGLVKLWDPGDPRTKTAMRGMGTPEYAPPEQYDAEVGHTDPRSDIYSLGATLYHALTGQAPPTATQRIASRSAFRPPKAVNPRVSPAAEAAILRAMELAVEDRFPTVGEMAAALGGRAAAVPADVGLKPGRTKLMAGVPPAAAAKQKRRSVWAWALGGLAVVALVLVMAVVLVVGGGGGRSTPTPGAEDTAASAVPGGVEESSTSLPSPSAPPPTAQQGLPSLPASTSTPMAGWTPTAKPPLPSPTPWSLPSPIPSPLPPPATPVPPTATPPPPSPTPVPPPPPPPPTAPPSQPTWTPPPP